MTSSIGQSWARRWKDAAREYRASAKFMLNRVEALQIKERTLTHLLGDHWDMLEMIRYEVGAEEGEGTLQAVKRMARLSHISPAMQTNDLPDVTAKFNPLHGQVLILPQKQEAEKKVGSIVLAGYESTFAAGIVLARGPGRCLESGPLMPILVGRGDTVYYHPDSAVDHRIDGQLYHIVNHEVLVGYARG